MNEETLEKLAQAAFEAYGRSVGGVNVQGKSIPKWGDLPEHIREAWKAGACEVASLQVLLRNGWSYFCPMPGCLALVKYSTGERCEGCRS